MTSEELIEKLKYIQKYKCETSTLELKSAEKGCPTHLYDTLSSFSNQDDGGIIIFGIDEKQDFKEVGVYDSQDIQKKINEQCLQMQPIVRPLLTVIEKENKFFVSAEIPGADIYDRPVYYKGKGVVKGSYIRVGDSDEPMTEYEVYSYEAYRKKYQDDVRVVDRVTFASLDYNLLSNYIQLLKQGKPRLAAISDEDIYELMSIKRDNKITLSSVMNFSLYPQAYFPQLCIIATVVPGNEIGEVGDMGERFLDNQRIEGNIAEMLDGAIQFVNRNITEGMPIQIIMFENRIEIRNPGGIYGRIRIDQLGKVQPDTRNPIIALELEVLKITENRYSGIPTIRRAMREYNLPEPEFLDERGCFIVKLYKYKENEDNKMIESSEEKNLIIFCKTPRTRNEICHYLGINSVSYVMKKYVMPLVERGILKMSIPDKPKSTKQLFYCE